MSNCDIKRIKATRLCRGDLKHLVDIQTRSLLSSDLDSSQPVEQYVTTRQLWCAIETVKGVARFTGVNIIEDATHLFWTPFDPEIPTIENSNTWILHEGVRYKTLRVDNVNELDTVVVIQTTERGDSALDASKA